MRSHSDAFDFHDLRYQFTGNGLEIHAQAFHLRNKLQQNLEIVQNEFWDSGFDYRPHLLEQRVNRLLLPSVGEISSKVRVQLGGATATTPKSSTFDCSPVKYSVTFQQQNQELTIEEKLLIHDMGVQQVNFSKFSDFLNQYYKNHFWGILLAS
jgi:hypothetical protein